MIPKAITAPFRWWAKHPWMTFWCTIPLIYVIRPLLFAPSAFVFLLSATILILCFSRGVFVTWQRSGIRAVLINVAVPLLFVYILAGITIPQFGAYRRVKYDSDVKSNLKRAAESEEVYYRNNGTFAANIRNLKGFKQGENVTIAVEATATTYVIIGTVTKGCKAYTGGWYIDSTSGAINGTPCHLTQFDLWFNWWETFINH